MGGDRLDGLVVFGFAVRGPALPMFTPLSFVCVLPIKFFFESFFRHTGSPCTRPRLSGGPALFHLRSWRGLGWKDEGEWATEKSHLQDGQPLGQSLSIDDKLNVGQSVC